jgi:hypothetical protein
MPEQVSIAQAAALLNLKPGTLRRWCREGLPYQPGRRGRGHAAMVDPEQARQWIGSPADNRELLALAGDIQQVLAATMLECFKQSAGTDKRRIAGVFAATWYASSCALLDYLREKNSEVPDVKAMPFEITYLQKIARGD